MDSERAPRRKGGKNTCGAPKSDGSEPQLCDRRLWPRCPMHYDTSEGKTRIELARRQDGKAARVKLGLFANVAETIDLRGSADRLAILTVLSCLTEATSRRAGVELPQYVDRILKGAKPGEFRSSSPRSSIW